MILVTGSSGFVGAELVRTLRERGVAVRPAVRERAQGDQVAVGMIDGATEWRLALQGCTCVIHLAARVHVMQDGDADPLRAYRAVNLDGTLNLARQAHAAGVKRFVFVSSVKVNGEATTHAPFGADDTPAPSDPYGRSKSEAEAALLAFGRETGLQVVIVRPPLVYGPGVKANFLNLVKLVNQGWPLPFGSASGKRSMVALDNLVDLLIVCSRHRAAAGRVFMVSDDADLTVGELARMIANSLGKPVRLVPVPVALMRAGAGLLGKSGIADRLFGSLQVDIAQTKAALQWTPVVTPQSAIEKTVAEFLKQCEMKKT